jgi:hypothetical protein
MENMHLHIISFDVPFPADYGGVIDVYHKLRWLHKLDVQVHLHCFEYGRGEPKELNRYCASVHYYKRQLGLQQLFGTKPYIVSSRQNRTLEKRLLEDDYPILCEGIHTTAILENPALANRKIAIRPTNVEHHYYHLLRKREKNLFKRMYFSLEAKKLNRYDSIHHHVNMIFPVSNADASYFQKHFSKQACQRIFPFHAMDEIISKTGTGSYVLFHGNLSVAENDEIARYIIDEIVSESALPIVIAGKNPSVSLVHLAKSKGVELKPNPTDDEMLNLVKDAHIQLMLTFQPTGFKHKLLLSLFSGRHVIANTDMLSGSEMESVVHLANSRHEILNKIRELSSMDFSASMVAERNEKLSHDHQNSAKAGQMIRWLR